MIQYTEERQICKYLDLQIDKGDWVSVYYGMGFSDGGKNPVGWQIVCHISKLKSYLAGKLHEEHSNYIKRKQIEDSYE